MTTPTQRDALLALADSLGEAVKMYRESRTTLHCVSDVAADTVAKLRALAAAGAGASRTEDHVGEAVVERISALLYEEATDEPWTVVGVEHCGPDRAYYRKLARKVIALAAPAAGAAGQGEAVAFAVYAKSDEYPKPVLLPDYVGSMDVIRNRVMQAAHREGFSGDFVERMAELGWWLEPLTLLTTPPAASAVAVDEAMVDALRWYAEQAELCRKLGSAGDPGRQALDADGGKRARAALTAALGSAGVVAVDGLNPRTADLVQRFATALAEKLAAAERKYGYSDGWADPDWMDECRAKLVEHVAKGDPRDVAAYCAFLWHHGERTALPAVAVDEAMAADVRYLIDVIDSNLGGRKEYSLRVQHMIAEIEQRLTTALSSVSDGGDR